MERIIRNISLPLLTSLSGGRQVVVDYMTDSQVSEMYSMIKSAARNGNGFGVDEYSCEEKLRRDIIPGHRVSAIDKKTKEMIGGFAIFDSPICRIPGIGDFIIVVKKIEQGESLGRYLASLILDHSRHLGYCGLLSDILSNNVPVLKLCARFGAEKVGWLRLGGRMPTGDIKNSLFYYKDLERDKNNQSKSDISPVLKSRL